VIGALNHWITLVVHKTSEMKKLKFEQVNVDNMLNELRSGNIDSTKAAKLTKGLSFKDSKDILMKNNSM
jgi:hypothetical protein